MTKTNYDTSKTGTELELTCMYDNDLSRIHFEDEIKNIEWLYRDTGLFAWTDCGQIDVPACVRDCYDLTACTRRDYRQFCIDATSESSFRDLVQDMFRVYGSWDEMAFGLLPAWKEIAREDFPTIPGALCKWEVQHVTGHCQGDYAYVLVPTNTDYKPSRETLEHLFYDSPIYCRLSVNGEEYCLDECLADSYSWDRDKVLEEAGTIGLSDYALAWVSDNLPEYPEYCY